MPDHLLCVSTPLGPSSSLNRVVEGMDVIVRNVCMPIDMLVLPMSDFDVVLGMNWLNKYHVVIDCFHATLSFEVDGTTVTHELVRQRPTHLPTFEL